MATDPRADHAELLKQLSRMSSNSLCQFLSLLTLELTILARGTYNSSATGVSDPLALRSLNECQHFLLGILRRLLFSETVDVPLFTQSLVSMYDDQRIGALVERALERSLIQVQSADRL